LLDCETKELSDEELIELEAQRVVAEKAREEEEDEPEKKFTAKGLSILFRNGLKLSPVLKQWTLMWNDSQRLNVSFKMLCIVIVRNMKKKKKHCSIKAQHVPHQENISYLNPRT
jgi:hypothetical protein